MSAGGAPGAGVEPFSVAVDAAVLDDLRVRVRRTRLPEAAPGEPWAQGTDRDWLDALLRYWAGAFDWRAAERELNRFAHCRARIGDAVVHFVHERARHGRGIPLILGHGWPSFFAELLPLVPLLTDPAGHGISGPAFDVVIPSLPGYGFSNRPAAPGGVTYRYVFPHALVPEGEPPREWAERLYDVRRWTVMPAGGHFAPAEEPELVARDIAAFFATGGR